MAKIVDILQILRDFAPETNTEPDFSDNVGLLLGSEKGEAERVLLCLDCTERVVNEAKKLKSELIISHHPAIFYGLKKITDTEPTGRMLLAAAKAGINIYSAHTNLDFCDGGINDYVAEKMKLSNVKPMEVKNGIKIGRVGVREKVSISDLVKELRESFDDKHIRYIGESNAEVSTVAVVNGGGGDIDFLNLAINNGADCYITADVPHHVALYAREMGIHLIIMQHYTMERVYIPRLKEIIECGAAKRSLKISIEVSKMDENPAR